MQIGIDARVLERKMTGIGRYLLDILKGIQLFDSQNKYTLFSLGEIKHFDTYENERFFTKISTNNFYIPSKLYSPFWLNFILPSIIEKNKIDIFFSPNNLLPYKKLKCKTAVVIHDINHIINKQHLPFFYRNYLNFQLPRTIKNSDVVITISENSKNEIIKFLNSDPEKTIVIYPPIDPKFKPIKITDVNYIEIKNKLNLPEKFILYIGVIENKKNILGILKIADIIHAKDQELKFLLIGKPGYGFKKIEEEIKKRGNVIYKNFIEEEYIAEIYNLAYLFLFPSYYEGFGIPPLEAMQSGIPVLASNIKSLTEIIGRDGFLHDPDDHAGFANDILKLFMNKDLYDDMKNRSIERAKNFSYEDSIKKLVQLFEELKNEKV